MSKRKEFDCKTNFLYGIKREDWSQLTDLSKVFPRMNENNKLKGKPMQAIISYGHQIV